MVDWEDLGDYRVSVEEATTLSPHSRKETWEQVQVVVEGALPLPIRPTMSKLLHRSDVVCAFVKE